MSNRFFDSEQEAIDYRAKHQLIQRVAVPVTGTSKWALVFDIPCHLEVRPHTRPD